jgi:hypothetical protein
MANVFDEITSMIKKIVLQTTKFSVPRMGIISQVKDELKEGRVLCHVPAFGWDTDAAGIWCYPKDKGSLITPPVGTYVMIEFIDGNIDFPVYSGIVMSMKNMIPKNYTDEKTQVIFEDSGRVFKMVYNENDEVLTMGSGGESFVKGDTFKPEFQKAIDYIAQLKADFTAWTPVPNDGGAVLKTIVSTGSNLKPTPTATGMLSDKIKGE